MHLLWLTMLRNYSTWSPSDASNFIKSDADADAIVKAAEPLQSGGSGASARCYVKASQMFDGPVAVKDQILDHMNPMMEHAWKAAFFLSDRPSQQRVAADHVEEAMRCIAIEQPLGWRDLLKMGSTYGSYRLRARMYEDVGGPGPEFENWYTQYVQFPEKHQTQQNPKDKWYLLPRHWTHHHSMA